MINTTNENKKRSGLKMDQAIVAAVAVGAMLIVSALRKRRRMNK
ncbi:hypothetical protein RV10_GL002898 [Enterococcus pallens]|nr:hypothetical protein RV10_GL002898 [Enterococcus pallens]